MLKKNLSWSVENPQEGGGSLKEGQFSKVITTLWMYVCLPSVICLTELGLGFALV